MRDRIKRKSFELFKRITHPIVFALNKRQKILFIFGSGRSGTTMLVYTFIKDYRVEVFKESDGRIVSKRKNNWLRLYSTEKLKRLFNQIKAPLIVLKPIIESHKAQNLLNSFSNAKAVWIYRDYKDVVSSFVKKWNRDTNLENIKPIVNGDIDNWRSENLSPHLIKIVKDFYDHNMSAEDAAAIFWYVRNSLFFEQELQNNSRVKLLKYEDLVEDPINTFYKIYQFIDIIKFKKGITKSIHQKSVKKGKNVNISSEIDEFCKNLYLKFEHIYTK